MSLWVWPIHLIIYLLKALQHRSVHMVQQYNTDSGGASYRQGKAYRPYHFRSGPTSGPTTRLGSQKSKISVVHSLAVLKGHSECLKCGKPLWRPGLRPGPRWGSLQHSPRPSSSHPTPPPLSALRASNLGPLGLAPCLPKSVYQNLPM